jgi:hypothetical protein
MSPIIRVVSGGPEEDEPGVHIPFDRDISMDHDDTLKAALPELQKELKQRWPVKEIQLRYRLPNPPLNMAMLLIGTIEGLSIIFLTRAAFTGGGQFGKDVAKEMARITNQWLRRCLAPKKKATPSRKRSRGK